MSSHEIAFTDKIVPDAFHGTNRARAETIARTGFKIGRDRELYLGDGVYFFESGKGYAVQWARETFGEAQAAVIHAIIALGRCLDLHTPEHISLVQTIAEELRLEAQRRAAGRKIKPITDPLVINVIALRVKIDTIRAGWVPHVRGKIEGKIYPGSHFRAHRLIVCVRNLKRILSVRLL